jgi:hypothetical protein
MKKQALQSKRVLCELCETWKENGHRARADYFPHSTNSCIQASTILSEESRVKSNSGKKEQHIVYVVAYFLNYLSYKINYLPFLGLFFTFTKS